MSDAPTERMPTLIRPMLAQLGALPEDDAAYGYEMKWDGVRAIAYMSGRRLRLLSRNDLDVTGRYPELAGLPDLVDRRSCVLDGEIVTFAAGRPSFSTLQRRMRVNRPAPALVAEVPVVYLVFDLLHLDGRAVGTLPYTERRDRLEALNLSTDAVQTPPCFPGPGSDVLRASLRGGLEGVLAKRLNSPYRPGRRSPDWIKVRHIRTQEVVVAGWRPGAGRRAGRIGSLLLGVYDAEGRLRYAGHVGTGFTNAMLDDLAAALEPLVQRDNPFSDPADVPRADARDAHWTRPELVGEVAYTEWTTDGRLRHPSWRGLRPDRVPEEAIRASPLPAPAGTRRRRAGPARYPRWPGIGTRLTGVGVPGVARVRARGPPGSDPDTRGDRA